MNAAQSIFNQPRSGIREILELAQTLPDVIHLEIGEPTFETPAHIVQAGCQAWQCGDTKYTPNAGIQPLRQAIANRISEEQEIKVEPAQVLIGIGGVEVINCAFRAICDPGDEILIPDPSWPNYRTMCTIGGIRAVSYTLLESHGFEPDMEELEQLVTARTRMLVINSPSNPIGVMFGEEQMKRLYQFAQKHDLFILSDEAYEKITFDRQHVSPLRLDTDGRVIAAYTCSKTYAMTGWRVGYTIASTSIVAQMAKLQEAYISSVPGATQRAAIAAITGNQQCVADMRREYAAHRGIAIQLLQSAGLAFFAPHGSFYVWIHIGCTDSKAFAKELLMKKHVAVAPGSAFGAAGEGHIRISLASSVEEISNGISRLIAFLSA